MSVSLSNILMNSSKVIEPSFSNPLKYGISGSFQIGRSHSSAFSLVKFSSSSSVSISSSSSVSDSFSSSVSVSEGLESSSSSSAKFGRYPEKISHASVSVPHSSKSVPNFSESKESMWLIVKVVLRESASVSNVSASPLSLTSFSSSSLKDVIVFFECVSASDFFLRTLSSSSIFALNVSKSIGSFMQSSSISHSSILLASTLYLSKSIIGLPDNTGQLFSAHSFRWLLYNWSHSCQSSSSWASVRASVSILHFVFFDFSWLASFLTTSIWSPSLVGRDFLFPFLRFQLCLGRSYLPSLNSDFDSGRSFIEFSGGFGRYLVFIASSDHWNFSRK